MDWTFEHVAGPFRILDGVAWPASPTLTEGGVWTGTAVLFVDIPNSRIMRYTPTTGVCDVFAADTNHANGLAMDSAGRLYVCESGARRVARYDPDGSRVVLADNYQGKRLNTPNDIVVDSRGRVWFTDPRYRDRDKMELDHDSVYRLDPQPDGAYGITRVTFDATRPNGLVLSPDGSTLYVAESPRGIARSQLRAYSVRADGSLGPPRVLHDFGEEPRPGGTQYHRGIDGMRVDDEGNVVAACGWQQSGPGQRVGVFSPDGEVLENHPTPNEPTNLCFGDEDLRTLYLTGFDGSLWRARTHRRGRRLI